MKNILLITFLSILVSCSTYPVNESLNKNIKYKKILLTKSLVDNDKKLIEQLLLGYNRGILKDGSEYHRANNIMDNLCSNNAIDVCPSLVILSSTGVLSPYATISTIVISQGTINRIKSDDQLAFILGHELSHIIYGHTKQANENQMVTGLKRIMEISQLSYDDATPKFPLVLSTDPAAWVGPILTFMVALPVMTLTFRKLETSLYKFDRGMEYQADISSIQLLRNSQYNPWGSILFWSKATELFGKDNPGIQPWGRTNPIVIVKTHPPYKNRSERLEKYLRQSPNK